MQSNIAGDNMCYKNYKSLFLSHILKNLTDTAMKKYIIN